MGQREAFQALATNTLSKSVPRLECRGTNLSMRTKMFVSTYKTPKMSNRAVNVHVKPSSGVKLFVTPRRRYKDQNRNRNSRHAVAFPSTPKARAMIPLRKPLNGESSSKDCYGQDRTVQKMNSADQSSDEDMDVCSASDLSLDAISSSPEESPPSATMVHFQPTPIERNQALVHHTTTSRMDGPSPFVLHPRREHRWTINSTGDQARAFNHRNKEAMKHPPQFKLTKGHLRGIQDAPADDPATLFKLMYSTNNLLGTEIGGDKLQQESLDGSEITASTLTGMPAFPPKDIESSSTIRLAAVSNEDMVEEWSLPDQEASNVIFFELDGKQYVHDPLPPGWVMKVSKTHNRPFYIHPDHGITWHCPIVLKSKSEALLLKRSSLGRKHERGSVPLDTSLLDNISPTPHPHSLEGSMSELIHHYNAPRITDGYDGSVSSSSSNDSDITSQVESKCGSMQEDQASDEQRDTFDWMTPLRADIVTPQKRQQKRLTNATKNSTPKLSPIEEDARANGKYDACQGDHREEMRHSFVKDHSKSMCSSARKDTLQAVVASSKAVNEDRRSAGKRSTPRVSFEPMEVVHHTKPLTRTANVGEERSSASLHLSAQKSPAARSQASPIPNKTAMNASTPISDTENTHEDMKVDRQGGAIEVVSVCHSIRNRSTLLYTPTECPSEGTSTLRDAPLKRKSLQLVSLSNRTPSVGTRPPKVPKPKSVISILNRGTIETSELSLPASSSRGFADDRTARSTKENSTDGSFVESDTPFTPQVRLVKTQDEHHDSTQDFVAAIDDSGSNTDEWSPHREEQTLVSMVCQKRSLVNSCKTVKSNSHIVEEGINDHNDHFSSPAHHEFATPMNSSQKTRPIGDMGLRSVQSRKSTSQSRRRNHCSPNFSTIPSPLSFNLTDGSPAESIQGQPEDYYENDQLISPPIPKRKRRPFNWRVIHPFHPLCVLQRLDLLLTKQSKRLTIERKENKTKIVQKSKSIVTKVTASFRRRTRKRD